MSQEKISNEAFAQELRSLISNKLRKTDLQWAYCEAAAVLSFFDPNEIKPLGGFQADRQSALENLLPNSEIIYDDKRRPQWRLRSEVRREALRRLHQANRFADAFAANSGEPDDNLHQLFKAFILGPSPDLDKLTRRQLFSTLQVSEWLSGLPLPALPNPAQVRQKLEIEGLLEPLRALVGTHFYGRENELNRLSDYVEAREASSFTEQVSRGIRSFFGEQSRPLLFIYGPGGIGKSTLLAKFILDHSNLQQGPEREKVYFTYLDFDRPSLSVEEPLTLLLEALRQLAIQYPENSFSIETVRENWKQRMQDPAWQLGTEERLSLSPIQRSKLIEAFVNSFDLRALTMLTTELNLLPNDIFALQQSIQPRNHSKPVKGLIDACVAQGLTTRLIGAALKHQPHNEGLLRFIREYPEFNPERGSLRLARRSLYLDEFAEEIKTLTYGESWFLLVLDTFEEVQCRSRVYVDQIFIFLNDLRNRIPNLRVVLSGRADVLASDLKGVEREYQEKFEFETLPLSVFDAKAAKGFLLKRGVNDEVLAEKMVSELSGTPLTLQLAAELLKREILDGADLLNKSFQQRFLKELRKKATQSQLYIRILEHISDPEVRDLAHPGLVLRRITPELILTVLAEPCAIKLDTLSDAKRLFEKLKQEVALVTAVDEDVLEHRPELRRVMLELLQRDKPAQVQQIHKNAVRYYENFDDDLSRTEELYHRLSLGVDRQKLQQRWSESLMPRLSSVITEFPPQTQTYVAARLGVEIKEEYWREADLEDWELYAERRLRELLNTDQPVQALQTAWQRAERSASSPLFSAEHEALIEAVKQMQGFFSIHLDANVTRRALNDLYAAMLWCVQNIEINEDSESRLKGNLIGPDPDQPLASIIATKISQPLHKSKADGVEVELALRTMLEMLRHGELKVPRQSMLEIMRDKLAKLLKAFEQNVAQFS
jgi:hypothetical protein